MGFFLVISLSGPSLGDSFCAIAVKREGLGSIACVNTVLDKTQVYVKLFS